MRLCMAPAAGIEPHVDEIEALRNEALQLLATIRRPLSPLKELHIRHRAGWLIVLADRLERAGLLERVRSSDDRRRVGLRLTEDGERLVRRVRARRTTWLADRLKALEPSELEAIELAVPALMQLLEARA